MNALVYWIGLLGGFLAARLMSTFFTQYFPGLVVPGWTEKPAAELATSLFIGGLLILLLTGSLAGRFSGAGSRWRAGAAGAIAGGVAALVVFLMLVAPAAGAWGFQPILAHDLVPAQDERQFIGLLVDSVVAISWWTWMALFGSLALGLALGGLGGLLAGPGGQDDGHLDLLNESIIVYSMVLAGFGVVLTSAINPLLVAQLDKNILKFGMLPAYPSAAVLFFPFGSNLLFFLTAQVAYLLLLRRAAGEGKGLPGSSWKMVAVFSLGLPLAAWLLAFVTLSAEMTGYWVYLLLLAILPVLGGVIAWRAWQMRGLAWEKRSFRELVFRQWAGLIGANITLLLLSLAISTYGVALNIVLLVIPTIVALSPGGIAGASTVPPLPDLVSSNFVSAAGTIPPLFVGMTLVFVLGLLVLWLFFVLKDRLWARQASS